MDIINIEGLLGYISINNTEDPPPFMVFYWSDGSEIVAVSVVSPIARIKKPSSYPRMGTVIFFSETR